MKAAPLLVISLQIWEHKWGSLCLAKAKRPNVTHLEQGLGLKSPQRFKTPIPALRAGKAYPAAAQLLHHP